jgi:serine/threonine protein kinase
MTDLRSHLQQGLSGSYALERELGRGGMATVFLAQDLKHDRPVALKVLHPELAASLGPDRFLREIKLAARLQLRPSAHIPSPLNPRPSPRPAESVQPAGPGGGTLPARRSTTPP